MLVRALLAFLALPGVVGFLIPLLIARPWAGDGAFHWYGLIPLVPGVALLLWCVREFYVAGKGTLAPWDPPRRLVSSSLYRVSRNPMYIAVSLILLGWALAVARPSLWIYAVAVFIAFHLRVRLYEEPYLARTHREEWKRYAARVPRWIFRSRRAVVVAWIVALVLLPNAGLIYEAVADDQALREFPAPGTYVDVGGRRLHMICTGRGQPVVMFVHSGFGNSLSSAKARELVSARTMVCSYDRAGHGWSDPGPDVSSAVSSARDLAVLQDRAKLPWPLVLVSSSIGGLTAEMFARQYPERTAGLVFLDAANSLIPARERDARFLTRLTCSGAFAARFGVLRLADPLSIGTDTDEARRSAALAYSPRPWGALCATARGLPDAAGEFEQAPPLPSDVPLTLLSASSTRGLLPPSLARFGSRFVDVDGLRAILLDSHQKLATLSTRGTWALVPDSEHLIGDSNPEVVADAVIEILEGQATR